MVIILVIIWQVFYDQNFKTFNTSKRRRVSEEISGEKDVKGRKRGREWERGEGREREKERGFLGGFFLC